MNDDNVGISIATLALYVQDAATKSTVAIGVLNKEQTELCRVPVYQALGGASRVSNTAKELLETTYGAKFLGEGDDSMDAHFLVPSKDVESVLSLFENPAVAWFCEMSPLREIYEKLPEFGIEESLLQSDVLEYCHLVTARQRQSRSIAVLAETPIKRLFFIHKIVVSSNLFQRIITNGSIRVFSKSELMPTMEGERGHTLSCGAIMVNNLCDYVPGLV